MSEEEVVAPAEEESPGGPAEEGGLRDVLAALTEEERGTFDAFRARVDEHLERCVDAEETLSPRQRDFCDDACLLRYLRARKWDLDASFLMLSNTLTWREEYRPEEIVYDHIHEEVRSGKMYVSQEKDKVGRPIIIMRPGLDDTTERIQKVRYLVWVMEEAIWRMDSERTGIEKVCLLVDYTGCGMAMAGINSTKISLECLDILQNHYPERMGKAFMLNPIFVFSAFWKIVSRFLDPETSEKIRFLKKAEYKVLKEFIDPESLEKSWGGDNDYKFDLEQWKANIAPFLQLQQERCQALRERPVQGDDGSGAA